MTAYDLTVTEVVVLMDEAVIKRFQGSIPGQFNFNRRQVGQGCFDRGLFGIQEGDRAIAEVVVGVCFRGRKSEISGSFQSEQQFPAGHVFEAAVRLDPVPHLAENSRNRGTALIPMLFDDRLNLEEIR